MISSVFILNTEEEKKNHHYQFLFVRDIVIVAVLFSSYFTLLYKY
jgi:hypothetical protein